MSGTDSRARARNAIWLETDAARRRSKIGVSQKRPTIIPHPRFRMTTANKITVVRILMIPAFVTMAIYYGQSIQRGQPLEWQRFTAIAIFLIAAVSDGLDGYVARHYNQRSSLGVILDPIADKGLLLSGIITLSITNWSDIDPEYGTFPAWFPVLVISRDAVILVGAAVLYLLNGKVHVKPRWSGKVATVSHMLAIPVYFVVLHCDWRRIFHVPVWRGLRNGWRAPIAG
jgi:CDP-diacylglycerol--glycerol-3-phosphate 3-phosphatidyltransferase